MSAMSNLATELKLHWREVPFYADPSQSHYVQDSVPGHWREISPHLGEWRLSTWYQDGGYVTTEWYDSLYAAVFGATEALA